VPMTLKEHNGIEANNLLETEVSPTYCHPSTSLH